jgi:hypothetical protein
MEPPAKGGGLFAPTRTITSLVVNTVLKTTNHPHSAHDKRALANGTPTTIIVALGDCLAVE